MASVESSNHERFELRCASAVLGEISAEELVEFRDHIANCSACQAQYVELEQALHKPRTSATPQQAASHSYGLPSWKDGGYRKRFLDRARGLEFKFSPEVEEEPRRWRLLGDRLPQLPGLASATAALALGLLLTLGTLGYILHRDRVTSSMLAAHAARLAAQCSTLQQQLASRTQTSKPSPALQSPVPVSPNTPSEAEAARIRNDYEDALARSRSLERQLAVACTRITQLEKEVASGAERGTEMAQRAQQAEATLDQTMAELRSLREHRTTESNLTATPANPDQRTLSAIERAVGND